MAPRPQAETERTGQLRANPGPDAGARPAIQRWCRDVTSLVDRSTRAPSTTDPPVGPVSIPSHASPTSPSLSSSSLPYLSRAKSCPCTSPKLSPCVPPSLPPAPSQSTYPRTAFRDFEERLLQRLTTTPMQKTALSEASSSTSKAVSTCVHLSYYIIHSFSVFILQRMRMAHLLGQLSLSYIAQQPSHL